MFQGRIMFSVRDSKSSPTQVAQGANTKITECHSPPVDGIGDLKNPMAQSDLEVEENIFGL